MERLIDFFHDRHMLCGTCGHQFVVDLDWIDRWEQGREKCPECAMTCEHEDAPRVTVSPGDPAVDDDRVARLYWYHTSTHPDWPRSDFDPAAVLTAETRQRMGGEDRVALWAARQRAKALHVGTYEAAIHNMLRRMDDQADHRSQFYLYRVRLRPTVVVREGWIVDPSDFLGDVTLDQVCPPGTDASRYLNYHEDPGGLSLALGRSAIVSVQQVAVPVADAYDNVWVQDVVVALDAAETHPLVAPGTDSLNRFLRPPPPPRVRAARELGEALADRLPINLRSHFLSAAALADDTDALQWARRMSSLIDLVENPVRVLALLDDQVCRQL